MSILSSKSQSQGLGLELPGLVLHSSKWMAAQYVVTVPTFFWFLSSASLSW